MTDAQPLPVPRWPVFVLLPLAHYLTVKLTFSLAMSPENEVVIWLPNALLLVALMHYRGQRAWAFAAATLTSDVLANLPVFPPLQAVLLSLCNLGEVVLTFLLLRHTSAAANIERIADFAKFIVAGPVVGAFVASLCAGAVLLTLDKVSTDYPTLVLLWWHGDALGLLICAPMLLAFLQPWQPMPHLRWWDGVVVGASVLLGVLVFSGLGSRQDATVALTPNLLLPAVLYIAARIGRRWTTLAVALVAVGVAWTQTTDHRLFGPASPHEMILRTQEFIFVLSLVGMGFALLFGEQRAMARELERKVRERTRELEESNAKLARLSATDGLTGVANRRRFDEALAAECLRARRAEAPLALALIDVDEFKAYNDRYGHLAGDDCLKAVAQVLETEAHRASDLVARYGGEEFAVISPTTDLAGAAALAETLRRAVENLAIPHVGSPHGVVSVSIGVAAVEPGQAPLGATLIERADRALYAAKAAGRNRVEVTRCAAGSDP